MAGLAAASLALGACNANLGQAAARVDGTAISSQQLNGALAAISGDAAYRCVLTSAAGGLTTSGAGTGTYSSSFAASILTTLVEQKALASTVASQQLTLTPLARKVARTALESQLSPPQGSTCQSSGTKVLDGLPPAYRSFLVELQADQAVLLAHAAGVPLTAGGLHRYAAAHSQATSVDCVSAIETSSKAEATSLRSKVEGDASFSALAKQHSIDAASASGGGALGCVLSSQIASSLGKTVAGLAPGQVSVPVPFGSDWVIFQLTSRHAAPPAQVASVVLQSEAAKDTAIITSALRKVHVAVDARYGSWRKVSGLFQVVPPKGPPSALLANPAAVSPASPSGTSPSG